MSTTPSGLPAGYTLEGQQQTAPSTPQGLPEGYTVETDQNTAPPKGEPSSDAIAAAMKPRSELSDTEKQAVDNTVTQNSHTEANLYGKSATLTLGGLTASSGLARLAKAAGYTGTATGTGELVNAAGEPIAKGAESVIGHLASTYGTPVIEAINTAAETHPVVAKILLDGLKFYGGLKAADYLKLFSK